MMGVMLDATLVLMLLCFFSFHAAMVVKNETTIEGTSPMVCTNNVGYEYLVAKPFVRTPFPPLLGLISGCASTTLATSTW